jgi:hypothetical protein
MRRHRPAVLVLVAATVVLSACRLAGGPGGSGTPDPSPSATEGAAVTHPAGDAVILQLAYAGGFVPAEYVFSSFPTFTLLGDGRVIVVGAQDLMYPGPALPPILVRSLTEGGVQAVLHEALASGQLDADADWRGAASHVADAADSVFRLHAGGRSVSVSVYALGLYEPGGPTDWLSEEELAAHRALSALADRLQSLETWLPASDWTVGEWQAYVPDSLGLLVRNVDGEAPDESGVERQERDWPLATDPDTFGQPWSVDQVSRCGTVTDAEAATWYAELSEANQLTRWLHDGHRYAVTPRLLLPGERAACAAS